MGKTLSASILLMIALLVGRQTAQANSIISLSASGGGGMNETINVSTSIQASERINNSSLFFQIISPGGTTVATHKFDGVPRMDADDTFDYSWSTDNSSFPEMGNYTLTVCWSNGNSQNCQIATASTTFYSANSLGFMLPALLLGAVALFRFKEKQTA